MHRTAPCCVLKFLLVFQVCILFEQDLVQCCWVRSSFAGNRPTGPTGPTGFPLIFSLLNSKTQEGQTPSRSLHARSDQCQFFIRVVHAAALPETTWAWHRVTGLTIQLRAIGTSKELASSQCGSLRSNFDS